MTCLNALYLHQRDVTFETMHTQREKRHSVEGVLQPSPAPRRAFTRNVEWRADPVQSFQSSSGSLALQALSQRAFSGRRSGADSTALFTFVPKQTEPWLDPNTSQSEPLGSLFLSVKTPSLRFLSR